MLRIDEPLLERTYKWCFNCDWSHTFLRTGKPPNRFYRFMLKWILGIHIELIKKEGK